MQSRAFRWLRKAATWVVLVALGVCVGKMCQYAAVEHFGDRLGFDLASAVGLAPFTAILIYLAIRFPRTKS